MAELQLVGPSHGLTDVVAARAAGAHGPGCRALTALAMNQCCTDFIFHIVPGSLCSK